MKFPNYKKSISKHLIIVKRNGPRPKVFLVFFLAVFICQEDAVSKKNPHPHPQ